VSRARRRKRDGKKKTTPNAIPPPHVSQRRRSWDQLLKRVFEIDPLICTNCGSKMRIISFITTTQQEVINRILDHLGESTEPPNATGPPLWLQTIEAQKHVEEYSHCYIRSIRSLTVGHYHW